LEAYDFCSGRPFGQPDNPIFEPTHDAQKFAIPSMQPLLVGFLLSFLIRFAACWCIVSPNCRQNSGFEFESIQDYAVSGSSFFWRAMNVAATKSMPTLNSSAELGFETVVVVRWANEKRLQTIKNR
jgi:hypothetical protein